jgi:hypothetical protein
MTQEILDTMNEILDSLKSISNELDAVQFDSSVSDDVIEDIDNQVTLPLENIIDSLETMLISIDKFDDINYYTDEDN